MILHIYLMLLSNDLELFPYIYIYIFIFFPNNIIKTIYNFKLSIITIINYHKLSININNNINKDVTLVKYLQYSIKYIS